MVAPEYLANCRGCRVRHNRPRACPELGRELVRQCHLYQPGQLRGSNPGLSERRRDVGTRRRAQRLSPVAQPAQGEGRVRGSEERSVGKKCVNTCKTRVSTYHNKKTQKQT